MASMLRWCTEQKMDAWHAVASFTVADASGADKSGRVQYRGSRTQANAQFLKCFWFDADIKRDGDKKVAERAYKDELEVVRWVSGARSTGLPIPNVWVKSGYGLHLYWVLEDAIPAAEWTGYAHAFRALLAATGAKGDLGVSIDSARLLRPPQTLNFKVPAMPMPVHVMTPAQAQVGDYPNATLLKVLEPYAQAAPVAVNYGSGGLTGAPPSVVAMRQPGMAAAAQANMPTGATRDHLFADIAKKCGQVKRTLDEHGANDGRTLWRGMLTLAHFCTDGADFVHPLGDAHPSYKPADTDAEVVRIEQEQQTKRFGAPLCKSFDAERGGICASCPHTKYITSPFTLGVPDDDLPDGYRRHGDMLQLRVETEDRGTQWKDVLRGIIGSPTLDKIDSSHRLIFSYARSASERTYQVVVDDHLHTMEPSKIRAMFAIQGVTLNRVTTPLFGEFVVSWIEKLRDAGAARERTVPSFGWVYDGKASILGMAVGGTFYHADGTQEPAPGSALVRDYQPAGDYAKWRESFDFVTKGRPDLQFIIAASFGAPLMEFTGEKGACFSVWSRESGIGKSSAFQVAATIWGKWTNLAQLNDTENATLHAIGQTQFMPALWDEIDATKDRVAGVIQAVFTVAQGRSKRRMSSAIELREVGEWRTILVVSGNQSMMDLVEEQRGYSDAGARRLFEIKFEKPDMTFAAEAGRTVEQVTRNYGRAGRIYAEWLAQNAAYAKSAVEKLAEKFSDDVQADRSERFLVAGAAAALAGAALANRAGVAVFDTPAIYQLLVDAFLALRKPKPVTGDLLTRTLETFYNDNLDGRLVTDSFGSRGKTAAAKVLRAPAINCKQIVTHTSVNDRSMRINLPLFRKWARDKNLGPADLVKQMEVKWGASVGRGVMGAGYAQQGARCEVLFLDLNHPDLASYADDFKLGVQ